MEYNGEIQLEIGKKEMGERESYIERQYYKLPLQVMPPFYQDSDGTVFIYLLNPSGGILDYDNFKIEVKIKDGAETWIGTPSATKIYKRRTNKTFAASQENIFHVGAGSILEYCPDEIIPYANSAFVQKNRFYLDADSTLIAWDIFSGGRALRGERFQFEQYASQTYIYVNDVPVLIDKMMVKPQTTDVKNLQCMKEYMYMAAIYAYSDACDGELADILAEEGKTYTDGLLGTSLVTEKLVVVKILGNHAYMVLEEVQKIGDILRERVLHKNAVRVRKF